jgi:hypothetical protein
MLLLGVGISGNKVIKTFLNKELWHFSHTDDRAS